MKQNRKHSGHERDHGDRGACEAQGGFRRHHGEGKGEGWHPRLNRHGMPAGRKLSSEDLQTLLLLLLENEPAHGYELIKSIEQLSSGFYAPSPGMIYPALGALEEGGFVSAAAEGHRKQYAVTESGKARLNEIRIEAVQISAELDQIGKRMAEARSAFTGDDEGHRGRHRLRGLLRGYEPKDEADAKRVAAILESAAAQIEDPNRLDVQNLLATIKHRRSMGLQRMKPDAVDRALVELLLEAANWAPSHGETEPWRFQVFIGEGRSKLAAIFEKACQDADSEEVERRRKRAYAAPVWIAISVSPKLKDDGTMLMSMDEEAMAVASAVQNLHLVASAMGLAGMWHSKGISVDPCVAQGLGIQEPSRLLGFFMLGWPATEWPTETRKPIEEKTVWFAE